MTLQQYLDDAQITPAQFAEQVGATSGAVRRWVAGTRIPDKARMAKIVFATGGQVTANDFFALAA